MQTKRTILYATCFAILLMGGCSKKTGSNNAEINEKKAVMATVKEVVEMEYTPVLNFTGTAEANKEVNLGSAIPGRVERINFPKGKPKRPPVINSHSNFSGKII